MVADAAISVEQLSHSYGPRNALVKLDLSVQPGEIFALLGPNGSGKTTLFRVLSTLVPVQTGKVSVFGDDLRTSVDLIRRRIGVVFQAPSLDKKLTVCENIRHQAALYGLGRKEAREREAKLLEQLGLTARAREKTETLSGGLRRRVELAKSLIHEPELLILDEPSTGLDPGARIDLWQYLRQLRNESSVTVLLTTHLLEEADRADRIAILNEGQLVACDSPDSLRATVGGDSLTLETDQPDQLAAAIQDRLGLGAVTVDGSVRLELNDAHHWINKLVEVVGDQIQSLRLGKPTLEDVFIDRTGHRFWKSDEEARAGEVHRG